MTADERALCARIAAGNRPLTAALADAGRQHGLDLWLAWSLSPSERLTPEGVRLVRRLTAAAALNAWREEVTRDLLGALCARGVDALLLKGTGLAYTVYPAPHLRPRLDVDLLIRRAALERAEQVLSAGGWRRPIERDAELSEPQRHYVKRGSEGVLHHLDLHWKIANPRVFADALTFEELAAGAVPVAALGASARTPGAVDALLIACVHRVAHHGDAVHLLWLWDVHLLAQRLGSGDRDRFIALSERTAMRAICARGLGLADQLFATPGASPMAARLDGAPGGAMPEPSSRFLSGVRAITVLRSDLASLSWIDRVRLTRDHVCPSIAYMRSRYPRWPRALLPFAYLVRVGWGAPKWFRRGGPG